MIVDSARQKKISVEDPSQMFLPPSSKSYLSENANISKIQSKGIKLTILGAVRIKEVIHGQCTAETITVLSC